MCAAEPGSRVDHMDNEDQKQEELALRMASNESSAARTNHEIAVADESAAEKAKWRAARRGSILFKREVPPVPGLAPSFNECLLDWLDLDTVDPYRDA